MAGIPELVMQLAGPAIEEVGQYLALPVKRQYSYLCRYNSNIQDLKDEAERLKRAKTELEAKVAHEENNAQVILSPVRTWLGNTEKILDEMRGIEAEIANVRTGFWGIKARFLMSKKAKKTAEAMKQLEDDHKFDILSMPSPPPASMVPPSYGQVGDFSSRKQIEEGVMKDLREKKVSMLGIVGMGGIGKTTLAKKLMNKVWEEKLFDEALMVVVSQEILEIKMLSIQQQIAESLGLSLDKETLPARARKLHARLTDNKRKFIVVDDIWETLKLEDLGIPCESGNTRCTLLFTSRSKDVLCQMNVKVFTLEILGEEEAWSLFSGKAGNCVGDRKLYSIARQVAKECRGLPLALVTVGSALKNQNSEADWNDALRLMKGSNLKNMLNLHKEVYIPLKLSYDYLKNQDAEYLFLLCSQFPEDYDTDLNLLATWCLGLRLFGEINSVKQTRDRIFTLVGMLKRHYLLLDGKDKNFVKMHDVVRDVAVEIAKEERLAYINQKNHCNSDCKWILMFGESCDNLLGFLEGSCYRRLNLLAIHDKQRRRNWLPFFEEMKELKSLSLRKLSLKSLPLSIKVLENLRTLHLVECDLECISIVGELLELEILVCTHCNEIKELPVEFGRLEHLKLLQFEACSKLKRIALGIISSLIELEELKIWDSFTDWESTNINKDERSNASLKELESLTKLTTLWIQIKDVSLVEEEIRLASSIVNYRIAFAHSRSGLVRNYHHGDINQLFEKSYFEKVILIEQLPQEIKCGNWIRQLIGKTPEVSLSLTGDGSKNCDLSQLHKNVKFLSMHNCKMIEVLVPKTTKSIDSRTSCGVFPILEWLALTNLPNLKEVYTVSVTEESNSFRYLKELHLEELPMLMSLEKISNQNVSLNNLSRIHVRRCNKLQNLFFLEKGQDVFFQLKSLRIEDCQMMKEVFYNDESEHNGKNSCPITFPKLETLGLYNLPSLMTFAKGFEFFRFPVLTNLTIEYCPKVITFVSSHGDNLNPNLCDDPFPLFSNQKIAFGNLKSLKIFRIECCNIWSSQTSNSLFEKLVRLEVSHCPNLRSLYSSPMIEHFVNIKHLEIVDCEKMEKIVTGDDQENGNSSHTTFSKLERLILKDLTSLASFYDGVENIDFPMLRYMIIEDCSKHVNIVSSTECNQSFGAFEDGDVYFHSSHLEKVSFGSLKKSKFVDSSSKLCRQIRPSFFGELQSLSIWDCSEIRILLSFSIVEHLVKLRRLSIRNCKKMVKVIDDAERVHDMSTVFPSLKWLYLRDLPILGNFSEWCGALELPSLQKIIIRNCLQMKSFTLKSPSTRKLKKIQLDDECIKKNKLRKMGGLNGILHYRMSKGEEESGPSKNDWEEDKIDNAHQLEIEEEEDNEDMYDQDWDAWESDNEYTWRRRRLYKNSR